MQIKKYIIIVLILFPTICSAQWTKGGNESKLSIWRKKDGTGRELMFNYFSSDIKERTGMGFNIAVDGRLWDIPVGFMFNNIEWKLGGSFRLSFQSTSDAYKARHFDDTANFFIPIESMYTLFTPNIYTDLRFNIAKQISIIPTAGFYYGFGNILFEDNQGGTIPEPKNILPNPYGYLYGVTLKIGPVGVSYRIFEDFENFQKGYSIDVGFKI